MPSVWRYGMRRSAPGGTERHICDESRTNADGLLIKPAGGPGRCRRSRRTSPGQGTPKRPYLLRVTPDHRHQPCPHTTQECRNNTHRFTGLGGAASGNRTPDNLITSAISFVPVTVSGCRPGQILPVLLASLVRDGIGRHRLVLNVCDTRCDTGGVKRTCPPPGRRLRST